MTIRMDDGAAELLDTLHRSQSCGVRPSRLSRTQPPTT